MSGVVPNLCATYGSLGTVMILLTWVYLTGLILLLGGEINSETEAAVKDKKLASMGMLNPEKLDHAPAI